MAKVSSPRDGSTMTVSLPRWTYTPGDDRGPDQETLDAAKHLVPEHFNPCVPADHPAFCYGLALHDRCFFWEAHEIWEAVWKAAPMNGRDRIALQALIQLANARLKRRMNRPRAAERLIEATRTLLGEVIARGAASEAASVAGRLRAVALRDQLRDWSNAKAACLRDFLAAEDEEKCMVTQALA
jgi:hypothetical protein